MRWNPTIWRWPDNSLSIGYRSLEDSLFANDLRSQPPVRWLHLYASEMSAPAAIESTWAFERDDHQTGNVNGADRRAMRARLAVKMMPSVIMTFGIAQWISGVLGAARLETMVIAFVWTIATGRQFMMSRRAGQLQKFRWSLSMILSALGGQILWVVLPCVQLSNPNAWFCATLAIPPMYVAVSGVVAVLWSLHPFVMGLLGRQASAHDSDLDAPVLYCSFFLLSGNLVFAASAYASVVAFFAGRIDWSSLTVSMRVQQQPILVCPIES